MRTIIGKQHGLINQLSVPPLAEIPQIQCSATFLVMAATTPLNLEVTLDSAVPRLRFKKSMFFGCGAFGSPSDPRLERVGEYGAVPDCDVQTRTPSMKQIVGASR